MKKPDIWKLVCSELDPKKNAFARNDWYSYIRRALAPEVTAETIRFYGSINCAEAEFPGLDYATPGHRVRLEQFSNHNQLFQVFDKLNLTPSEIHSLCMWEGTKHAKDEHERKNEVKIRDTTWDDVETWVHPEPTATIPPLQDVANSDMEADEIFGSEMESGDGEEEMGGSDGEELSEAESDDELQQSVGVDLNQRLLAATEARARGEPATLDAAWEQWMKEREAAEANANAITPGAQSSSQQPPTVADTPLGSWVRHIPEIFSDNARPHIAALRSQLPPPLTYVYAGQTDFTSLAVITPFLPPC